MDIETRVIHLDQFLKSTGLAQSGGQAKHLIQNGLVKVNGEIETRRGRKLIEGETVTIDDQSLIVNFDKLHKDD